MSQNVLKNIIRISCVALIALYFMPCFVISCSGYKDEVSAFDVTIGSEVSIAGESFQHDTNYELAALAAIPLLLLLIVTIFRFKVLQGFFSIVAGALEVAGYYYMKTSIEEIVEEEGDGVLQCSPTEIFWIIIAISCAVALFGFLIFFSSSNKAGPVYANQATAPYNVPNSVNAGIQQPVNYQEAQTPIVNNLEAMDNSGWFCSNCGKRNEKGVFCPNCGTRK